MTDTTLTDSNDTDEKRCLVAEFATRAHFDLALEVLDKAGFSSEEVSTVLSASEVSETAIQNEQTHHTTSPPPEKTTAAMTLAGGTLGAALGTATMIGPLLIAGPLLGMAVGAIGGGVLSATHGHSDNSEASDSYEARVRNGSSLIVITGDEVRLQSAKRVLKTTDHRSIELYPKS